MICPFFTLNSTDFHTLNVLNFADFKFQDFRDFWPFSRNFVPLEKFQNHTFEKSNTHEIKYLPSLRFSSSYYLIKVWTAQKMKFSIKDLQ